MVKYFEKLVKVYHAKEPNFGISNHPAWNDENYRLVARLKILDLPTKEDYAEAAFTLTQNIDNSWAENVRESSDWVAEGPQRSTSVGDVIVVGKVVIRCEAVAWKRVL